MWTISPIKALNLQGSTRGNDDLTVSTSNSQDLSILDESNPAQSSNKIAMNKMAERVLLRLQEKLAGVEDSIPLSVTGQVSHLIQEAIFVNYFLAVKLGYNWLWDNLYICSYVNI